MNLDIRDVPCGSCCTGYSGLHFCDSEMFCPCDRGQMHTNALAERIDKLERECGVGPYANNT